MTGPQPAADHVPWGTSRRQAARVVLSEPALALRATVSALAAQDAVAMPGEQALAEATAVLVELERLHAVALARIADVHTRQLHTHVGAPSTSTWVEGLGTGMDRGAVSLAKRLTRLPELSGQVLAGGLSTVQARLVAQALEGVRRHVDRPDGLIDGLPEAEVLTAVLVDGVITEICAARGGLAEDDPLLSELAGRLWAIAEQPVPAIRRLEAAFLVLAQHVETGRLCAALGLLVDALLPVQLEDRAARGHRKRGLVVTRNADGSGFTITRGELDLECGELLLTALAAAAATDPANPIDTAAWAAARAEAQEQAERTGTAAQVGPDGAAPAPVEPVAGDQPGDPRSRPQRTHDALKLALQRLLDSAALGTRDKAVPHVLVVVGLDSLHDPHIAPGARPATTTSGTVVPRSLAVRWLADSRISRVVLGLGRRVLTVSHSDRTLKAHERQAMAVQWGHSCAAAGCHPPPGTPIVPHHADPWARSRTTALTDTVPLCESSHHDLHSGHQVLRLKDGRYLGPDGWTDGPSG